MAKCEYCKLDGIEGDMTRHYEICDGTVCKSYLERFKCSKEGGPCYGRDFGCNMYEPTYKEYTKLAGIKSIGSSED